MILGLLAPLYTWSNSQVDNHIQRKLDRALGNAQWMSYMLNSYVSYGTRGLSDHCSAFLHLGAIIPKVKVVPVF